MKTTILRKTCWIPILLFAVSARGQEVNGTATDGSQSISGVDASVHADVTEHAKQPPDSAVKPNKQFTNSRQRIPEPTSPTPTTRFWPEQQQSPTRNSPSVRAGSENSDANPDARLPTADRSVFQDLQAFSPDGVPRKIDLAGSLVSPISPKAGTNTFSGSFPNKPLGLAGASPFTSAISKATPPRQKAKEHRQKIQPQTPAHSGHQTSPFDPQLTTKQ